MNTLAFRLIITAIILIFLSVIIPYHIIRGKIHNFEISTTAKIQATKIQETLTIFNNLSRKERIILRRNLKREDIFYITGTTPFFFPEVIPVVNSEDIRLGVLEIIDHLKHFRVVVAGQSDVGNLIGINEIDAVGKDYNKNQSNLLISMIVELSDGTFVWVGMNEKIFFVRDFIPLVVPILIISIPLMIIILLTLFWVLQPLRQLTKAAQTIGNSIHQTPKLPKSNVREIQVASDALQNMHQSLKQQFDRLVITLGALSHDLRTPLQRLRLRAELLTDENERENIHRDIAELHQRVEDGLFYLRVSGGDMNNTPKLKLQNEDFAKKVAVLIKDYQTTGADINLHFDDKDNWSLNCDWSSFTRALGNIIDNALHYGIRAEVDLHQNKNKIIITVRDFGKGIEKNQIEQALTPFVRLDSSRNSNNGNNSGLGLAIAKAIMHWQGGELILYNHPQGGLVVKLVLPKNKQQT